MCAHKKHIVDKTLFKAENMGIFLTAAQNMLIREYVVGANFEHMWVLIRSNSPRYF